MFDIGFTELLLVGIVALIVVGPKDLPLMFRALGRFTAKIRRMAREFSSAMEDAADSTGVKDVAKGLQTMANPGKAATNAIKDAASFDPFGEEDNKDAAKPTMGPETAKMTEERKAQADKIRKAAEERAAARRAAEEAAAEAAERRPAEPASSAPPAAEAPAPAPAETPGKGDAA